MAAGWCSGVLSTAIGRELSGERLPDHDLEHRLEARIRPDRLFDLRVAELLRERSGGRLGPGLCCVVAHERVEVVVACPRHRPSRRGSPAARAGSAVSLAAPSSPLPLRTVTVTSEGLGTEVFDLPARRRLRSFLGSIDVRVEEVPHRRLDRLGRRLELGVAREPVDLALEEVPRRKLVQEARVPEHLLDVELALAAAADLDGVGDHVDDARAASRARRWPRPAA